MNFIDDISKYEPDFKQMGIENLSTMNGILEVLNQLAEITYYIEKTELYDKEEKTDS